MFASHRKSKIAIAMVWLACALAFAINHWTSASLYTTARAETFLAGRPVKEIEGYRNWTKVNSEPQLMPSRVAAACAAIFVGGVMIDGKNNPHRDKYFTVYVNDAGRDAMLNQKSPSFPEGSVIVKEKLSAKDSQTPELLTVMIKQKKGFNPASGDWEYMVLDGTGTKLEARGNMENCQSCHLGNKKMDYIFRTYLSNKPRSGLR
jgi:hypothetical protein